MRRGLNIEEPLNNGYIGSRVFIERLSLSRRAPLNCTLLNILYRVAGNFGEVFNLASSVKVAKLKTHQ